MNLNKKGLTLLEVIAALLILSIAILGFHQGQAGVVKLTLRTEAKGQAYALAQKQMSEIELTLQKRSFKALADEEKGEFKHEKLGKFKWVRTFERVDLSCFLPSSDDDAQGGYLATAAKFLEESIRKIKVVVQWTEGSQTFEASLAQLYVKFDELPSF